MTASPHDEQYRRSDAVLFADPGELKLTIGGHLIRRTLLRKDNKAGPRRFFFHTHQQSRSYRDAVKQKWYAAHVLLERIMKPKQSGACAKAVQRISHENGGRFEDAYVKIPPWIRDVLHFGEKTTAVCGAFHAMHFNMVAQLTGSKPLEALGSDGVARLILGDHLAEVIGREEAEEMIGLPAVCGKMSSRIVQQLDLFANDTLRSSHEQFLAISEYGKNLLDLCKDGVQQLREQFPGLRQLRMELLSGYRVRVKASGPTSGKGCIVGLSLPNGRPFSFQVEPTHRDDPMYGHRMMKTLLLNLETAILSRIQLNPRLREFPVLDLNDGLVVVVPEGDGEEVAVLLRALMHQAAREYGFELGVQVGLGVTWGDAEQSRR